MLFVLHGWCQGDWLNSAFFFCKQKQQGDSRAPLAELKKELENSIGKLGTTVLDSKIQVALNFMFQNVVKESSVSFCESIHVARITPPAPTFDSEMVHRYCVKRRMCALRSLRTPYILCRI